MLTCERQGGYYSSHQLTQGDNSMIIEKVKVVEPPKFKSYKEFEEWFDGLKPEDYKTLIIDVKK